MEDVSPRVADVKAIWCGWYHPSPSVPESTFGSMYLMRKPALWTLMRAPWLLAALHQPQVEFKHLYLDGNICFQATSRGCRQGQADFNHGLFVR